MANWCFNNISFSGRCKNFIKQLKKHDYNSCGFEIVKGGRCVFDLQEVDDGIFQFESKWIPPNEELLQRAKKGRFSFENDFEELAMNIYGKAIYDAETDSYQEWCLPDEVFDRIDYTDDGDQTIDGVVVDEIYTFLENEMEKLINNKN